MRTYKYKIRNHPKNKRLSNMLDDLADVHNHDLAFYQFVQVLDFKCHKHMKQFLKVNQWTATTKPCSNCGHQNENLSLEDRQWICSNCNSEHDRDINAAINILRAAYDPVVEQI